MWILLAIGAGSIMGAISVISKICLKKCDSDYATAIRMSVAMVFFWALSLILGLTGYLPEISLRSYIFLILSGIVTGFTWIFYFKALSMANINQAVPICNSNTFLTTLFAMLILGELDHLAGKIIGVVLIICSLIVMYERKSAEGAVSKRGWFVYAFMSAVCAALSTILSKIGIQGIETTLAMAVRIIFIVVIAWLIALFKNRKVKAASGTIFRMNLKQYIWSAVTGILYGCSLLCFYEAVKQGVVGMVAPIDKMCVLVVSMAASVIIREKINKRIIAGIILMAAGTVVMAVI